MYERTRNATRRFVGLFDAYPLPTRQRRLTKAEWDAELADRETKVDILDRRRRRALIFANDLLEATYQALPQRYHPDKISIAVDATRLKSYARGIGKARLSERLPHERVSAEPDDGFYLRNGKGHLVGEDGSVRLREYSLEAEFAVLTSNDPHQPDAVPNLILGYDLHTPGVQPVASARRIVDSLVERGHSIDHFATDRAYLPAGDPAVLQNPLRAMGVKLVMDYPNTKQDLGVQAQAHGSVLIDGSWYCPSIMARPDLVDASKDMRDREKREDADEALTNGEKTEHKAVREAKWKLLVAQRTPYLLREKAKTDEHGKTKMMCPAAGASPTASCPIKPVQDPRGNRMLLPISMPKAPGKLCSNKTSTTFDIADGGKWEQHYQYGSDEWSANYHHPRNQVEAMNAYVKDPTTFALAEPGRRRMRGRAAQGFLHVMTIAAVNLQRIRDFLLERDERAEEETDGVTPPPARTNRSRRSTPKIRMEHRRTRRRHGEAEASLRT